jgi:hypothetical protein
MDRSTEKAKRDPNSEEKNPAVYLTIFPSKATETYGTYPRRTEISKAKEIMVKIKIPQQYQGNSYNRLPKPGEKLEGLSGTTLLQLGAEGRIRTVTIRRPNARRGINLCYMPSLIEFLEGLPNKTA